MKLGLCDKTKKSVVTFTIFLNRTCNFNAFIYNKTKYPYYWSSWHEFMQEAVAWLVKLSPWCFCSPVQVSTAGPGRIIHYPALTNWPTRAQTRGMSSSGNTDIRCIEKQFVDSTFRFVIYSLSLKLSWFFGIMIDLFKFKHIVCGDESDSRYKVPTFHIIFYSWQRRWAGPGRIL